MSGMHLVRGMSSLNTKKRKANKKSAKLIKAEANHEAWLKSMGVGKSKLPTNAKGERTGIYDIPDYSTDGVSLGNHIGNGPAKDRNQYTGTEIAGIATMHKSNAVPVRKDSNDAIEIAKMRR